MVQGQHQQLVGNNKMMRVEYPKNSYSHVVSPMLNGVAYSSMNGNESNSVNHTQTFNAVTEIAEK